MNIEVFNIRSSTFPGLYSLSIWSVQVLHFTTSSISLSHTHNIIWISFFLPYIQIQASAASYVSTYLPTRLYSHPPLLPRLPLPPTSILDFTCHPVPAVSQPLLAPTSQVPTSSGSTYHLPALASAITITSLYNSNDCPQSNDSYKIYTIYK